jgi:hypothetical protein
MNGFWSLTVVVSGIGGDGFGFNLDVDFGSGFQFDMLTVVVGESIRNANLSVEVIGTFDRNLRFLWFAAPWIRMNYPLDLPGKCGDRLGFLGRHRKLPPADIQNAALSYRTWIVLTQWEPQLSPSSPVFAIRETL